MVDDLFRSTAEPVHGDAGGSWAWIMMMALCIAIGGTVFLLWKYDYLK